jgi:hypothetical protein
MSSPTITLTGLDGANPLAFLAALGVLRVLHHRARQHCRPLPKLSWTNEGCWRPVIHGSPSIDAIIGEILEDKDTWQTDPAFLLAYDETGENLVDPRKAKEKITRDLKPKPSAMRAFLENLAGGAVFEQTSTELLLLRRALDTAAAYGSEIVQDRTKGCTKPTAFHFTAGQQQFMKAVSELQARVTASDLQEALAGPWRRESTLPNMSWDATNSRFYALRAKNPATDKKTTIAGADWLAFIGLGTMPSFPRGTGLVTTGIKGGWKDSTFTWAVWENPVAWRVASSIVRISDLARLAPGARRVRSIGTVFSARIFRLDPGGYGIFGPAEVR